MKLSWNMGVTLAVLSAAGNLFAVTAMNTRPIPLGSAPAGQALQDYFNAIGATSINTATDQSPTAYFHASGTSNVTSSFVTEFASDPTVDSIGIYDLNGNTATLYDPATYHGGSRASLEFSQQGLLVSTSNFDSIGNFTPPVATQFYSGFGPDFGFIIKTDTATFYSDDAKNSDGAHFLAYQGKGDTVTIPGGEPGTFNSSDYLLAFSDGANPNGPNIFTDAVVAVESLQPSTADTNGGTPPPVPEPMTLALIPTALGGLALRRKFTRANA